MPADQVIAVGGEHKIIFKGRVSKCGFTTAQDAWAEFMLLVKGEKQMTEDEIIIPVQGDTCKPSTK